MTQHPAPPASQPPASDVPPQPPRIYRLLIGALGIGIILAGIAMVVAAIVVGHEAPPPGGAAQFAPGTVLDALRAFAGNGMSA